MKKIIAFLCVAIMLFSQVSVSAKVTFNSVLENPNLSLPNDPATVPVNGTLDIQGEDIVNYNKAIARPMADENASGGKVMYVDAGAVASATLLPADPDKYTDRYALAKPDITIEMNIEDDGLYYVWVRVKRAQTYYYSYDGGQSYIMDGWLAGNGDAPYFWEKICALYLEEGKHELLFAQRTRYLNLDRVVITKDATFMPVDADDVADGDVSKLFPKPEILPPEGHPRIFLTKEDIPRIKENLQQPVMAPYLKYMTGLLKSTVVSKRDGDYTANVPRQLRFRSLAYLLDMVDEEYARKTIEHTKEYLSTAQFPNSGDITRQIGDLMYACAIVYDYHYDILSDEDKDFIEDKLLFYMSQKEVSYPAVNANFTDGHSGELEIFRDMLSVGIAIYDENPEVYNIAAGIYFSQMAPVRRWFYQSGAGGQGDAYSTWRMNCELYSAMMFNAWGVPTEETLGDVWKAPMKWYYARRPDGGEFREGDTAPKAKHTYETHRTPEMTALVANMYPDTEYAPYLRGEWLTNGALIKWNISMFETIFLWDKDNASEVNLGSDLPLSWHSTYPITQVVARTSWQRGLEAPTAMAFMQLRENMAGGHLHADLGQFQLYYKGMLAIDAGNGSDGNTSAGGAMFAPFVKNYQVRSIAHNVLTVKDPEEIFFYNYYDTEKDWEVIENDGGQMDNCYPMARYRKTFELLQEYEQTKLCDVKGIYIGPNEYTPKFTYAQGDLTNAYAGRRVNKDTGVLLQDDLEFENKPGTMVTELKNKTEWYYDTYKVVPKISDYKRSMVFVDLYNTEYPAAFICFDKVDSTDASFEKKWLLHTEEEPEINGDTAVVKAIENDYNGKMVLKALYPENPKFELIGGEGRQFEVNGTNMDAPLLKDAAEWGNWRIEISPSAEAKQDMFLNVMYFTDYDKNLPELPTIKENQGNFVGVTIMDRVVLFSKDAKDASTAFSLNIRDNNNGGKMSVLVADVAPGMWKVTGNGVDQYVKVEEDECALYFEALPGTVNISLAEPEITEETYVEYPQADKEEIGDFLVHDSSTGLYLYQPYPTKLIDDVPYAAVKMLTDYYKADTVFNGNSATITKNDVTGIIKADTREAIFNNDEVNLKYEPKMIDGVMYAAIEDMQNLCWFKMTYEVYGKTVFLRTVETLTTYGIGGPNSIRPISVEASGSDGNVCENLIDDDLSTRWSQSGREEWVLFELDKEYDLSKLQISFLAGDQRATTFEILYSVDGENFTQVYGGTSSGKTTGFEDFPAVGKAKYIRIDCHGNTANAWNSISEITFIKQ